MVQRLFPTVPVLKEPDPVFLNHGLERGGIDLRGMSQSPRPDQPATFLFIQTFLDTLGKPGLDEKSANFQAIQLREALDHVTPDPPVVQWERAMRDMAASGAIKVDRQIGVYRGTRRYRFGTVEVRTVADFPCKLCAGGIF